MAENQTSVLDQFFDDFPRGGKLLILAHNHPDPDTIASAAALQEIASVLGKAKTTIAYGGVIGRAENAHMVKVLKLHLVPIDKVKISDFDRIAMVDTQPHTGNNALPSNVMPHLVIDHHPKSKSSARVPFLDIKTQYGATASILSEYLFQFDLPISKNLATALVYAIKSETQDLGRETYQVDVDNYQKLFPLANKKLLAKIVHAHVPQSYFQYLMQAIQKAKLYSDRCIVSRLRELPTPDLIPEIADLFMKMEGVTWALCMGQYQGALYLSIRTTNSRKDAGKIMKYLVRNQGTGGGHMLIAGGRIPTPNMEQWEIHELKDQLEQRFLKLIGLGDSKPGELVPSENK
jgi:nanoRNase/pAp phosphatase (c-di-AMP/oligoRNAs hydrolase)